MRPNSAHYHFVTCQEKCGEICALVTVTVIFKRETRVPHMTIVADDSATNDTSLGKLRRFAPVLLGFALFVLGAYALYHLLSTTNLADVRAQARAIPMSQILAAVAATFVGYIALVGYDWSALRYLGKKLPMPVILVGGFLGYSFGNTVGISAVSGGAVRYRIYSAFGLNAFDVAAISTFVSLAFGLGITFVGLAALAIHPAALGDLVNWPTEKVRIVAILSFALPFAFLTWLSVTGKVAKWRRLTVFAPSPAILFGQIGFTVIDTAMAALALYVLMPAGTPDFITFFAIFAAAAMIGVLSHVPGASVSSRVSCLRRYLQLCRSIRLSQPCCYTASSTICCRLHLLSFLSPLLKAALRLGISPNASDQSQRKWNPRSGFSRRLHQPLLA